MANGLLAWTPGSSRKPLVTTFFLPSHTILWDELGLPPRACAGWNLDPKKYGGLSNAGGTGSFNPEPIVNPLILCVLRVYTQNVSTNTASGLPG
ncbi:hypothetical protein AC578_5911 [Pseudocercospora eumusae]|uniref:Uncharacterized protein n=1 Tax=Pseudocercospora eumusae TaxID=321146 RepID=A0A139HBE7_9PEZI|nr:hypothetical protein AC578_5911 [Pseudocercospora eumusae]